MSDARPTLLVLRALGLGDFLTGVPALRALRRAFPAHRLVLAAPRAVAPLVRLAGAVDELLDAAPLAPLPRDFAADVAVNLHGSGPQSHRVLLAARPHRLLAFAHAGVPESHGGPAWRDDVAERERWCAMLRAFGIDADAGDLELRRPPSLPWAVGATVLHPGAASGSRRWPVQRFATVARAERAAGRRILVTGSPAERPLAEAVVHAADLDATAMVAGDTDLAQLAAIVGSAGRVVCGDTGVGHLATALRTPSVLLFGPCAPSVWGPPPDRPWHRVLWTGHTGDPHAQRVDPGLLGIGADEVVAALATLPPAPAASVDRHVAMVAA